MKKIKLADHNNCTGCAACAVVCPTKSITMTYGEDGFLYPILNNETCIKCGKCMGSCFVLNKTIKKLPKTFSTPKTYCAWNKNKDERRKSTSGGTSFVFIKKFISEGGYVCGAAFNNSFHLEHIITNDFGISKKLIGSKYLQSDVYYVYKKINELLKDNKKVLFIGTPCQVEGLKNITQEKYYINLITCDILCHGVNSPKIWKSYVDYLENKYKSKLINYNFRDKTNGWSKMSVKMQFESGKKIITRARRNHFHCWFGNHLILRNSCFNCMFRTRKRNSDITIADFWNIEKILPEVNPEKGVSFVMVNTLKGRDLLNSCTELKTIEVDYMKSTSVLKGMHKNPQPPLLRKNFIDDYNSISFIKLIKKYDIPSFAQILLSFLKAKLHI